MAQRFLSDDGSAETALITMKSTGLKTSRQWNSMISGIKLQGTNGKFTPPMFSHIYHLTTVDKYYYANYEYTLD